MSEFESLVERTVLQVLEKQEANKFPKLLTAAEIEELTNGKVKRDRVYELAKHSDQNGFPVIRFGGKDVKVLEDELIKWLRAGGCPMEDDEG